MIRPEDQRKKHRRNADQKGYQGRQRDMSVEARSRRLLPDPPDIIKRRRDRDARLAIFSPLILTADLLLLLRGEVICDVESLSDLLGRLALDHVGDGLATNIKKRLMLAPLDNLFKNRLVDLWEKVCVNYAMRRDAFADERWGKRREGSQGKVTTYVGNGNRSVEGSISEILKHVLNQERALGNEAICGESVYLWQSRRGNGAGWTDQLRSERHHCWGGRSWIASLKTWWDIGLDWIIWEVGEEKRFRMRFVFVVEMGERWSRLVEGSVAIYMKEGCSGVVT
jgi:hypothetical protein